MPRNPATDPRPGDVLGYADSTWTVEEVGADGVVYFTDGSNMALGVYSDPDGAWTYTAGPDDAGGPFADPPAPTPDDVLDVVERHARTLTALLTAAQLADDSRTPPWARGPAEAWLRGQFDALGGGGPAAPAERDPRTDPRPGDTKTWTNAYGDSVTQTVTATGDGVVSVEEPYGPGASFDDLTRATDWAAGGPDTTWACGTAVWTSGGAS